MRLPYRLKRKSQRIIASLLLGVTVSSSFTNIAFAGATANYSDMQGSVMALGSPLSNESFEVEDWNEWEMITFGVFISNFVEPFKDDYVSAFTEGTAKGSQGAGLKALQFNAGGDYNAGGTLNQMLNYCKTTQSKGGSTIKVQYNYYEYDHKMTIVDDQGNETGLGSRDAYLDDLFPKLSGLGDRESELIDVYESSVIDRPILAVYNNNRRSLNHDGDGTHQLYLDTSGESHFFTGEEQYLPYYIATQALLPKLYIGDDIDKGIVLDFTNGYDLNIMAAMMSKVNNPDGALAKIGSDMQEAVSQNDSINDMLGQKYKLYLDAFGNICIFKDERYIVVLPAACNRNLHKEKSENLLNSLVVNGFMVGSSEEKMVAQSSSQVIETIHGGLDKTLAKINGVVSEGNGSETGAVGLPAVCLLYVDKDINKSNLGKTIIYADTDSYLVPSILKYLDKKTETKKDDKIQLDEEAGDGEGNVLGKKKSGSNLGGLYYNDSMSRTVDISELDIHYGEVLREIMDDDSLTKSNFKIEVTGTDTVAFKEIGRYNLFRRNETVATDVVSESQVGLSILSNMFPHKLGDDALVYMYVPETSKNVAETVQPLFKDDSFYYLTPAVNPLRGNTTFYKSYMNYLLKFASNKLTGASGGTVSAQTAQNELFGSKNPITILKHLVFDGTVPKFYPLVENFAKARYELKSESALTSAISGKNSEKLGDALKKTKEAYSNIMTTGTDITKASGMLTTRIAKVYVPSDYFSQIANVFDLDPSTQFKAYTTNIYLTYLKYYGVLDNKIQFDENLFTNKDFLNIDPGEYVKTLSAEEKEKETKNNAFLLLSPTKAGREYRMTLFDGMVKDTLSSAYNKIMNTTNDASGQQVGFLNVSSYKDNVFTTWIFEHYNNISLILFGIMFIVAFAYGILSKQGITWFILMACTMLISISAVPKYTEITPYICNRVIQSAFGNNTIYWAAVEDINNIKAAKDSKKNMNIAAAAGDTEDEYEQRRIVATLRRQSVLQQDKALMIKNDISKKVIEALSSDFSFDKLQSLQSTRWLLPSLMRQISGDNGTNNYVYTTLNDLFFNMSQSYLMMNKDAASEYRKPAVYNPTNYDGITTRTNDWKTSQWADYKNTESTESDAGETYKSTTRVAGSDSDSHAGVYFLESSALGLPVVANEGEYTTRAWDDYADNITTKMSGKESIINSIHSSIVLTAGNYNSNDDPIGTSFPYLWSTENIGVYMYCLVNDTFHENTSNRSLDSVAYNILQSVSVLRETKNTDGTITREEIEEGTPIPSGVEAKDILIRKNFMFQGSTGYLRDFLDLEEVFTNMVPYLWQMQLTMGGSNGTNGMLGDAKLGDNLGSSNNPIAYSIYKNNSAAWMYQSNWVTKLMTDKKWNKPVEVRWRDSSGALQKRTIVSMINPRNYPAERPMIFSEAQMYAMGLDESYLNQLELRLLHINDEVSRQWTELINYVNIEGITKETIYRLMAVEAMTTFNKELTNKGFFDDERQLFPYSIDLRNITFDSLMRKLLSSSSRSSSYSSAQIMESVVENSGAFIGVLVIAVSFVSAIILPFLRDVVLVFLLLFTILSIILNVYNGHKEKLKATGGWLITYTVFAVFTALFYFLFALTIGTGTVDNIISSNNQISFSIGSLPIKLLLILALDGAYMYLVGKFIWKVIIKGNGLGFIRDGGFGFFYDLAQSATSHMRTGFSNVGNGFRQAMASTGLTNPENAMKVEVVNKNDNSVNTTVNDGLVGTTEELRKNRERGLVNQFDDSGYTLDEVVDRASKEETDEINKRIQSGSQR